MNRKQGVLAVVAAVLMGGASWFGHWAQPDTFLSDLRPKGSLMDVMPARIGDWVQQPLAMNVQLPPDVAAQLKSIYTETVEKVYVNSSGEHVMVTVAYGRDQSDGFKVHRPEVCYSAQGFNVQKPVEAQLDLGQRKIGVQHVDTAKGDRYEPVTYWMVIGDRVVNTPWRHKLQQIDYAFHGVIADGLLVRVSSFSRDPERAYELQAAFVRQWMMHVPVSQRSRLFGN